MHKNSKYLKNSATTALVLSGGFSKAAIWHIGVMLGLEELGYSIQKEDKFKSEKNITTIVGSSAGALIGSMLTNGYSAFEIAESQLPPYNGKIPQIKYSDIFRPNYSISTELIKSLQMNGFYKELFNNLKNTSGLFTTEGIREYLLQYVIKDDEFINHQIDFFVVATQLDHSRKCVFGKYKFPNPKHDPTTHYYKNFKISDSVSASMSVPILYSPVKIKNPNTNEFNYFLDGEIRDTLSTHVAAENNCNTIISSWIYTPYHYQKEIGSLNKYGIPAIGIQSLNLLIQKKIVSSRSNYSAAKDIIQTVNQYCKDQKLAEIHRKKLLRILELKLNYKQQIKYIDIYPKNSDTDFFFSSLISLSPQNIEKTIQLARRRTIEVLNNET